MCSENDRVVEAVDRVDDVDASLATLLSELIFGCTAAGAVNVELNKPKRPLPNAVDGIFGLFGPQICSLNFVAALLIVFQAVFKRVFPASWSARVRTFRKHAKLGFSYFNNHGRGNRSQCVQVGCACFWPVTVSKPEWSQQASSVCSSPSTQG